MTKYFRRLKNLQIKIKQKKKTHTYKLICDIFEEKAIYIMHLVYFGHDNFKGCPYSIGSVVVYFKGPHEFV